MVGGQNKAWQGRGGGYPQIRKKKNKSKLLAPSYIWTRK